MSTEKPEVRVLEEGVSGEDISSDFDFDKELETALTEEVSEIAISSPESDAKKVLEAKEKASKAAKKASKGKSKAEKKKIVKAAKKVVKKALGSIVGNAFDYSLRVRENAERKGIDAKPLRKDENGKLDSPYNKVPIRRNANFRVAFALSITGREALKKEFKTLFPETLRVRNYLKGKGVTVGKGYTVKTLNEGVEILRGLKGYEGATPYGSFSGFSPKGSTRFSIFSDENGIRTLYYGGINNPEEDRPEDFKKLTLKE